MSTTRGPKSRERQWLHWHPPLYMPAVLFRQQPHEYRVVKKDISRSNAFNVYLFIGSWEAIYSGTPVNLDSANPPWFSLLESLVTPTIWVTGWKSRSDEINDHVPPVLLVGKVFSHTWKLSSIKFFAHDIIPEFIIVKQ